MTLPRRVQFVYALTGWMLASIVVLTTVGSLSLELFLLVSLTGLLLIGEYTTPLNVAPEWRRRFRWIALAGTMIFAYLVVLWVLRNLPEAAPL